MPTEDDSTPGLTEEQQKNMEVLERTALPAYFIDYWHTLTGTTRVRLVLGEEIEDLVRYRIAVSMSLDDAERLAKHLQIVVKKRRAKMAGGDQPSSDDQTEI